jgi:hypothetical protein
VVLRVVGGFRGYCATLLNTCFGELLQHISVDVVLVAAAALTRVLAVQVGLCNTLARSWPNSSAETARGPISSRWPERLAGRRAHPIMLAIMATGTCK